MFGRNRAPAEVRAFVGPDERVLAWAPLGSTVNGRPAHVVATNVGLWWPDPHPRLIPWHLVVKASWSERGLTVIEATIDDEDLLLVERPPLVARLNDPQVQAGRLPPVVKQRVEASVARTHEVPVTGGSALVVGRRVPGEDGLSWWARLSPGTIDTGPVRAQLAEVIGRLRAEEAARQAAL